LRRDAEAPRAPAARLRGTLAFAIALGELALGALLVAGIAPAAAAAVAPAPLAASADEPSAAVRAAVAVVAIVVAAALAAWRAPRAEETGGGLLAGPQTRRGFLGRLAFAGAAVGAAATARDPERAFGAGVPSGCNYGRLHVNVCYTPFKVLKSEAPHRLPPGHRGVAVRKGPSPDAPIVYKGGRPVVIPVGEWFGRQSGRDGGASKGCPPPPPRPAVSGFVVGYPDILGTAPDKTGWIATEYEGETFAREDPHCPHIMCGPASLDFDCRGGTSNSSPYRALC